jgi:hypothetical protein
MDTWNKKVKVNKKMIPKKTVLAYYRKLWAESPGFRSLLKKKGAFIRATYDGKTVIKRRKIKFNNWGDVEEAIKEHAVEFHIPVNKLKYKSYVDIDMPKKYQPDKHRIARSIVNKLKKRKINISLVTDAPSGVHVFSKTNKSKLMKALNEVANEDKRLLIGKSSETKVIMDPNEPNAAIPGSLSYKGTPYKRLKL